MPALDHYAAASALRAMGWEPEKHTPHWYGVCKNTLLVGKYTPDLIERERANGEVSDLVTEDVWAARGWVRKEFRCSWNGIPEDVLIDLYLKIVMEGI